MANSRVLAVGVAVASFFLPRVVLAWAPQIPECTSPFQPFVYVGCYQDNVNGTDTLLFHVTVPDSNNVTIEECVAECKGNGYRYAGLEYYQECFCGATVDGPAADESQCSYPCTGNSSEICGGDSILSVYEDPTFETVNTSTIADYSYVGCWTDDSDQGRALAWSQSQLNASVMTTELCLQTCKDGEYPFAGTEYAEQCWCGVVIGNGTASAPSTDCNIPCAGDASETCGGSARLSLYVATDLESLQPCGYNSSTTSSSSMSMTTSSTTSMSSSTWSTTTTSMTTSTSTTTSMTTSTTTSMTTSTTTSMTTSTTSTSSMSSTTTSTTSSTMTSSTTTSSSSSSSSMMSTTKMTTSTTTSSSCWATSTIPSSCEYGCGDWCSCPLPDWCDKPSCDQAHSACLLQVSSCFQSAGWPGAADCFSFSAWCDGINSYCGSACSSEGGCSKSDCFNKTPPKGGSSCTTISTMVPCKTTTSSSSKWTTTKTTTTSTMTKPTSTCVPSPTGICKQASNFFHGYGPGNPVGGIEMPCLSCNNAAEDYAAGNVFKLYNSADSADCPSFPSPGVPGGCKSACQAQYDSCVAVYATGCKEGTWKTDSYNSAMAKCSAQLADCEAQNWGVSGQGECGKWCNGW